MELYFQVLVEKLMNLVILFGALTWGFIGVFRINIISALSSKVASSRVNRYVYIIIGLCAIIKLFSREYYLPFLGKTAYPCDSMELKTPEGADTFTTIKVKPRTNVVYWAAEGRSNIVVSSPWKAYDKYANAGVAISDDRGIATLKVRQPSSYKVPTGITLKPHIHYRECMSNGMLSKVRTVFLRE